MQLADIVRDRKVCVFLHPGVARAVERAGAAEVADFTAGGDAAEGRDGRILLRRYRQFRDVRSNNADVLILDGRSLFAGRRYRYFGQAKFVLVPAGARAPLAALFFIHVPLRKLALRGTLSIEGGDGASSRWLVFENVNPRFRRRSRVYVSTEGGLRPVFESLRGLNYCVLRWHRKFGEWQTLGDLDVLVHQDDLAELRSRLEGKLGFFAADIYSAFRLSGYHLKGTAYVPPARAVDLLSRAIEGGHGERRPNPRDTLSAFAYHLLFHKHTRRLGPGEALRKDT
jgi:hypothetical protein